MKHVSVKWKTTINNKHYYGGVNLVDDDVADELVRDGNARYLDKNDAPKPAKTAQVTK